MPGRTTLVRSTDRSSTRWKNGTGKTDEIARGDGNTPQWRVSLADLGSEPSSFSSFEGRQRVFTVVGQHAVRLVWDGGDRVVDPLHPFTFDGGVAPTCTPTGSTSVFNVMVDKASGVATVETRSLGRSGLSTDIDVITIVFVLEGNARFGAALASPGDCFVVRHDAIEIEGRASLLVARIELFDDSTESG